MESIMVSTNIQLIKEFVKTELPSFSVLSENAYSMYWEIILTNNQIEVKVSGDAGGFSISVFIQNTQYPLWQYDRKVNDMAITKDENILSQLKVLKRLIKELN